MPLELAYEYAQDKKLPVLESHVKIALENLTQLRKLDYPTIIERQFGVGTRNFIGAVGEEIPREGMLVIPVFFNGEIVSYALRALQVGNMLVTPLKFYKPTTEEGYLTGRDILYNCDEAFAEARKTGTLCIMEDPWSSIKFSAIGLLGSSLSEEQLHILLSNFRGRVVVCMDNDSGGQAAGPKIASQLMQYYDEVCMVFPKRGDPDTNIMDTKSRIQSAKPLSPLDLSLNYLFK
jgi:hypothetical protein